MNDDPRTKVKELVPMLGVASMERSLRYYVEGLGFTRKNQWIVNGKIRWCWLVLGSSALMLQEFKVDAPEGKAGAGVSLWFQCEDSIAIYYDLRARGIEASEPQVGNGLWDTHFVDPDGYHLHFESPTDVPEETKLSEWQR
jgi:hypothetical protein